MSYDRVERGFEACRRIKGWVEGGVIGRGRGRGTLVCGMIYLRVSCHERLLPGRILVFLLVGEVTKITNLSFLENFNDLWVQPAEDF